VIGIFFFWRRKRRKSEIRGKNKPFLLVSSPEANRKTKSKGSPGNPKVADILYGKDKNTLERSNF
jgi:hypothetical protein